jgi:hypothetical protein
MPSPDGRRDAVMFQRDCGATTGFSTQISILDTGGQPAGSGNGSVPTMIMGPREQATGVALGRK